MIQIDTSNEKNIDVEIAATDGAKIELSPIPPVEVELIQEDNINVDTDNDTPVDVEINGEIYNSGGLTPAEIQKAVEEYLNKNPIAAPAKIGYVTLLASAWEGSDNLYKQIVDIEGVTANSQVDLTPDVQQLAIFYEKDLTFVTENENGIVTVYVIGQKPANDYTMQVTITEVII